MQLHEKRVVLTGASSGIGRELAQQLAARGARILLVGRRAGALQELEKAICDAGGSAAHIAADITTEEGYSAVVTSANRSLGGVDILINNAGVSSFGCFADTDPAMIEMLFRTNIIAPALLTRALLPQMIAQGHGRIVNLGSIFGSLGFAWFTAYSSSKYALRGFSEALRRELHGTGVGVTYVAPRAVRTAINSAAVYHMAEAVKMKMDEPDTVARWIVNAIEKDRQDAYYGLAESFFVKLNSLLPRVVDRGLCKQNRIMAGYAQPAKP